MSLQVIQHLVKAGTISPAQADICQTQSRHLLAQGERVQPSDLVARNRFAHPRKVAEAFTTVHGTTALNAAELLPAGLSARLGVIPVSNVAGVLTVKAGHRLTSGQRTAIFQAATPAAHELKVIAIDSLSLRMELGALNSDVRSLAPFIQKLRDEPTGSMLRQALDALLAEAVRERASDIHLERVDDPGAWVSYRIDGKLNQRHLLPARVMAALVTRIKTEAGMDASNTLVAQDGRLSLTYQGRQIDYRVNAQPVAGGETLALRVLDAAQLPTLEDMYPEQPEMQALMRRLSDVGGKKGGIVLITGATGSGKSTTLYGLTQMLPREGINVMTVEDPVEYTLPFARQIQLNAMLGQTAGDMERSLLRQDPDVILLGEIRDAKSARAALKFAESGHMVLATLHAHSTTEIFERVAGFFETKAEKEEAVYVLAQHLLVGMHQELVEKLCHHCAVPNASEEGGYKRLGCSRCTDGIKGRALLHETLILPRDVDVRLEIQESLSAALSNAARLKDIKGVRHITKRETAARLVQAGVVDRYAVRDLH